MKTRTNIINKLFEIYGFQSYLEIGVRIPAENFDLINAKSKHSVDPDPMGKCDYITTSDRFFENHAGDKTYDIIFIDGLHTAEQVYIDVINSIKHLNDGGFIVMHDCNPRKKLHQVLTMNGTVWKAFARLRMERADLKMYTIDTDWGIGLITRGRQELFPKQEITFGMFVCNRKKLMQLISVDTFKKEYLNEV